MTEVTQTTAPTVNEKAAAKAQKAYEKELARQAAVAANREAKVGKKADMIAAIEAEKVAHVARIAAIKAEYGFVRKARAAKADVVAEAPAAE